MYECVQERESVCVCVGGVEKSEVFSCEVLPVLSVKEKHPGEVTGENSSSK